VQGERRWPSPSDAWSRPILFNSFKKTDFVTAIYCGDKLGLFKNR
jgi:hypothetical protein